MRITAYTRLTKNQLKLVKVIANNYAIPVSTLLDMGFQQTMLDCVQRKGGLTMDTHFKNDESRAFIPSAIWSSFKLRDDSLKLPK